MKPETILHILEFFFSILFATPNRSVSLPAIDFGMAKRVAPGTRASPRVSVIVMETEDETLEP